jgi:uncharacterized UBP type Zn finger protein
MPCKHLTTLARARPAPVTPRSQGCEECLALRDEWVHLRLCMTCGHVGCCDSSPNRHATRHFHETKHPVVKSFEPNQDWGWCYADHDLINAIPSFPVESPSVHCDPPYGSAGAP